MSFSTALLVVDAQESLRHHPYFREADLTPYLARQQALIDGAQALGLPVVQIFMSRIPALSPRHRAL